MNLHKDHIWRTLTKNVDRRLNVLLLLPWLIICIIYKIERKRARIAAGYKDE